MSCSHSVLKTYDYKNKSPDVKWVKELCGLYLLWKHNKGIGFCLVLMICTKKTVPLYRYWIFCNNIVWCGRLFCWISPVSTVTVNGRFNKDTPLQWALSGQCVSASSSSLIWVGTVSLLLFFFSFSCHNEACVTVVGFFFFWWIATKKLFKKGFFFFFSALFQI